MKFDPLIAKKSFDVSFAIVADATKDRKETKCQVFTSNQSPPKYDYISKIREVFSSILLRLVCLSHKYIRTCGILVVFTVYLS